MGKVMDFPVGAATVRMIETGDRVCAHVASGKTFEPETLAAWAEMCGRGGTVIDVGGYTGLFSISAALLGCRPICFEPLPANADRIRKNARLNQVGLVLHQEAASDRLGTIAITYNPNVQGMTSGASLIRKTGIKLNVATRPIDALKAHPVAIKIDVERAEPIVLAGARETIARCRPALLVEVLDETRAEQVRQALPGYRVHAVLDVRNWMMLPC